MIHQITFQNFFDLKILYKYYSWYKAFFGFTFVNFSKCRQWASRLTFVEKSLFLRLLLKPPLAPQTRKWVQGYLTECRKWDRNHWGKRNFPTSHNDDEIFTLSRNEKRKGNYIDVKIAMFETWVSKMWLLL